MKKIIISMILLSTLIFCPHSFGEEKETINKETINIEGFIQNSGLLSLKACVAVALANNPDIQAAISQTDIYKTRISQSWSNYFPQTGVSSGYARKNPFTKDGKNDDSTNNWILGSITVNQLLFDFGKTSDLAKISKANHEISEAQLENVINETVFNVKDSYYYLLYTLEKEAVLEKSVKQYEKHLEQAEVFYKIGTKPKIFVTSAKSNLASAKVDFIKAKNDVDIALARLNSSMGFISAPDYRLQDKLEYNEYDVKFDELVSDAYEKNPLLKTSALRQKAAQTQVNLAGKAAIPSLYASSQAALGGENLTDDESYSLGLSLEIPLFNAYYLKKKVDESKFTLDYENACYKSSQNKLFLNVKQDYLSYIQAKENIAAVKTLLEQTKENYRLVEGMYKAGLSTPIELKDAEQSYRTSQLNYILGLYNYNRSIAEIEKVIGKSIIKKGNDTI